jgi:acetyl-CoA carboxylase carboxyltransferase component
VITGSRLIPPTMREKAAALFYFPKGIGFYCVGGNPLGWQPYIPIYQTPESTAPAGPDSAGLAQLPQYLSSLAWVLHSEECAFISQADRGDLLSKLREIVDDFWLRSNKFALGGGQQKIDRQHKQGKLFVRERIDLLFDPDSFVEIDKFVEHRCTNFGYDKAEGPGDGVVVGYGKINGRLVYLYADDFTVFGGSLGEMHAKKICKVLDMAVENGAPVIGLHDSGGGRIQEGVDAKHGYGEIFYRNSIMSGAVPQISAIIGPCAGGAVYSPALTDFIIMVDTISHMFVTGPNVIKAALSEEVTEEELGGAQTQNATSGVAHFKAANEDDCFALIKALLGYLPQNAREKAPRADTGDWPDRPVDRLLDIVPVDQNMSYDMKQVINEIVDTGSFLEVQPLFAANIIIGFARFDGHSVGIVASQPRILAGCIDINASDKAARFIRCCDAFNIPLVTLVDVPGFLPGINQETGGIIRHGAKMLYAFSEATVPKITMVIRKAYGGAHNAMCSKELRADQMLIWPTGEIAVMGAESAARIIFKKEIEASPNPEQTRQEKIREYRANFSNPYAAAKRGYVDRVIDPSDSRIEIIRALEATRNKDVVRPYRKHCNLPL